jgi:hypothetical protein
VGTNVDVYAQLLLCRCVVGVGSPPKGILGNVLRGR